jgi:N-methylhydantoinase A/oxoprolinase/acetone carboxylase beta subunit
MRLVGQFHDIELPVPAGRLSSAHTADLAARFESEYRRRYGAYLAGRPIQALNWRVLISGPRPRVHLGGAPADTAASAAEASRGYRRAYFPEGEGFIDAAVYDRYRLRPGAKLAGPAIVEEREATTVVAPDDTLLVDGYRNLILTVGTP